MEKKEKTLEIVDKLTEKLVLSFNDNEFVKSTITKLKEMSNYFDIEIDNNSITGFKNSQIREIKINNVDKTIKTIDLGIKEKDNSKTYYKSEMNYKENGEKYTCNKYIAEASTEQKLDKTIVYYTTYSNVIGGSNDKCNFYSSYNKTQKYEKYSENEYKLLEESINKKDFYRLANGDTLKIVNTNGKERYFYCDSSVLYGEDSIESNKPKFNVELDEKKAKDILINLEDSYALINNDTIYNIKGKSY